MKNPINYDTLDVNNPCPRTPLVVIADVSGSMNDRIDLLHQGVCKFITDLQPDEVARYSVEFELILFADKAEKILPFTPISAIDQMPPPFVASGCTAPGEALEMALADIKERQVAYRAAGIPSYAPHVFLLGDGGFNRGDWRTPGGELRVLAERGKCLFYGIEIGDIGAKGHRQFCELLPKRPGPAKMRDATCFLDFFRWLSVSMSRVSRSTVGEESNVEFPSPDAWICR